MKLKEEIDRLGGVEKFANKSEAEKILHYHGESEVKPYLVTSDGQLFVVCGGQVVMGFAGTTKISNITVYIVVDSEPSRGWNISDPHRGPKPNDVLRLVLAA